MVTIPMVNLVSELREANGETVEFYFLAIHFEDGQIYSHDFGTTDKATATRLLMRVYDHLDSGGTLDMNRWHHWRNAYGSSQWDELAEVEREYYEDRA